MSSDSDGACQLCSDVNYGNHWDAIYDKVETQQLGWYEESPMPTLELITKCNLNSDATILNVGVGASTLIDDLLALNYSNIIASDLSASAINTLKERLGAKSDKVEFIVDDLMNSEKLSQLTNIDVWNDRAVLHFFLTENDRATYFDLLKKVVKKDGFAIIATFAIDGAQKCCGLDVYRYNAEMMQNALGNDFELIHEFNYDYENPSGGIRPYIYTLFKRVSA